MGIVAHVDVIDSDQRGTTRGDGILRRHTYSFGNYYNLKRLNFGTLRVFNDDSLKPEKGFSMHRHQNIEIITVVLSGELEHRDSLGNQELLRPGSIQRISSGKGVEYSQRNLSTSQEVRFLQIWVYPAIRDLEPSYEQRRFAKENYYNQLFPVISQKALEGTITIHQDTTFFLGEFDKGKKSIYKPRFKTHGVYVFVIRGEIKVESYSLKGGDSAQITGMDEIELSVLCGCYVLLIEVNLNAL